MPKLITTLPVGTKVKDLSSKDVGGNPIIWEIMDFNHAGYPANSVTLGAHDPTTITESPYTPASGQKGSYLNTATHAYLSTTFYNLLSSPLKSRILDTTLEIRETNGGGTSTPLNATFKVFSPGFGETIQNNGSYRVGYSTSEVKLAKFGTNNTFNGYNMFWTRAVYTGDANGKMTPISTTSISFSYSFTPIAKNVLPLINIRNDVYVSDNPDTDGAHIMNLATNKFLFQDGTDIKKYIPGTGWSIVGAAPVTKSMFDTDGMTDLSVVNNAAIQDLISDTPELLCWTDEIGTPTRTLGVTAIPEAKLILPTGDLTVENVDAFKLDYTMTGTSDIKVLVSGDSGVIWKGNGMQIVDPVNLSAVKANGFTPDQINSLTKSDWQSLITNGKVRFAFYLEQDKSTDVAAVDRLTVNEITYTMTPSITSLSVLYDLLNPESPEYYVSRDDGAHWKRVEPDVLTKLDDLPSGKALRVKAVLKNGQELHGLSYSWI
jgi:hypothetical protein